MKAGNNNRPCIRVGSYRKHSSSNASMRGKEMGNIGMLKGGLLAWFLRQEGGVIGDVVEHSGISDSLGVYRREEGEEQ